MQVCLATLRPLNFSKEKRKKKKAIRSSGRFQKSKFFKKKILPDTSSEIGVSKAKWNVLRNGIGGDFFLKPVGLELDFLYTWNLSLLPFFYLFIFEISNHSCYVFGVESEEVVSIGIVF